MTRHKAPDMSSPEAGHAPSFDPDGSAGADRTGPARNVLTLCVCLTAGHGGDEEPRIPEAPEDPGGAEHRQDCE